MIISEKTNREQLWIVMSKVHSKRVVAILNFLVITGCSSIKLTYQNKAEESKNQPHYQPENSYEGANGSKKEQVLPY